jgi:hypothetical protein
MPPMVLTPANQKAALLYTYTTAFLWASLIFVIGAVVSGLVLKKGNLATPAGGGPAGSAERT